MAFAFDNSFPTSFVIDEFIAVGHEFEGEDPFAALLSPLRSDDQKMAIEETPSLTATNSTSIEEEFPLYTLPSSPKHFESSMDNHSKDGLKFSRKLASLMLNTIESPNDIFDQMMKFSSGVFLNFLNDLKLYGVSSSEMREIQNRCLQSLWVEFKDQVSYKTNKKICLVKQEYWNKLFDKKSCTAFLKQVCETLSMTWKTPAGKMALNDAVFCELFSQVLFYVNKLAVIVLILKDTSKKGAFLRDLETVDNFVLMLLFPELMQLYNHKRGKFALECCQKCKICKSRLISDDFLSTLSESRRKMESIVTIVNEIFLKYGSNSFETGSCLVEFAITQL